MKSLSFTRSKNWVAVSGLIFSILLLGGCGGGSDTTTTDTSTDQIDAATDTGLYDIVDTNQIDCYNSSTGATEACSGIGYDADYSGNQPSYTLSADGLTVTDNVTDLVWMQGTDLSGDGTVNSLDKRSLADAESYCSALNLSSFGGYTGWHLPDIKELYSLILFSGKDASNYTGTDTSTLTPFIDSAFDYAFGDTGAGERIIDGQYATSTSYVHTTMNGDPTMFGVNFVDGRIKGYPKSIGGTDKEFYVRCVSGNTNYGMNQFSDNTDDTISDIATGLMWQRNDAQSTDWDDAVAICGTDATASYSDWRLPNIKELQSIVDYSKSPDTSSYAAIDSLFNATSFINEGGIDDWGYYWASTTHVDNNDDGTNATYVSFGRALGYFNAGSGNTILDVHGAGAQRSNDKLDLINEAGASAGNEGFGAFYYHGPQGDILRLNNMVRCVRNI